MGGGLVVGMAALDLIVIITKLMGLAVENGATMVNDKTLTLMGTSLSINWKKRIATTKKNCKCYYSLLKIFFSNEKTKISSHGLMARTAKIKRP